MGVMENGKMEKIKEKERVALEKAKLKEKMNLKKAKKRAKQFHKARQMSLKP